MNTEPTMLSEFVDDGDNPVEAVEQFNGQIETLVDDTEQHETESPGGCPRTTTVERMFQ